MANTGVLPFVRGIDFTNNDFSVSSSLDLAGYLFHPTNSVLKISRIGWEISKCGTVDERRSMVKIRQN